MSSKSKVAYVCRECGAHFPKWMGQCTDCSAWNTLIEEIIEKPSNRNRMWAATEETLELGNIVSFDEVSLEEKTRFNSGLLELDRVLGGGLVTGSVVLLGGDPGIGKSTLLLQALHKIAQHHSALYITGEESLAQVALRAKRLGLDQNQAKLLSETGVERILQTAQSAKPSVMVIDSIQTMFTQRIQSAPGGVGQVRESAAVLVQYAKTTGTTLFLVGHVTREGTIAGPRVLEHMVDTVLYFEGDTNSRYRIIRSVKNRFGAVGELGIFAMTDKGLREITNPSAIFLSGREKPTPGTVVMPAWEGSRPILAEVQALVDQSYSGNPRRITVGLDYNRLSMLLAVLHRHAGVATYDQDVFLNVVGGMRILETAADLAILLAVISSLKNKALPLDWVVFGEVGLSGEIRPVQNGQERLKEASKIGFKHAIVPKANAPKQTISGMEIFAVQTLAEALGCLSSEGLC